MATNRIEEHDRTVPKAHPTVHVWSSTSKQAATSLALRQLSIERRMPMTYVSFLRHVDALLSGISLQQQILPAGIPIAHSNKALHVNLSSRSSRDLCELDLSLPQIDRKAHFLQSILQGRPLLASEFLVARQNFTKS